MDKLWSSMLHISVSHSDIVPRSELILETEYLGYRLHSSTAAHRIQATLIYCCTQDTGYTHLLLHIGYRLHSSTAAHRIRAPLIYCCTQDPGSTHLLLHIGYRLHSSAAEHFTLSIF